MSPTGKFTFKLVIYGAFLLYLVGDLFLWHGFLAGRMDAYLKPMPGPPGDNSARIAEVYGEPVTANQLSRRIAELQLLRRPPVLDLNGGIRLTHELDVAGDLAPRARYDLIGSSLLRLKTSVNDLQLPNRNAEAARAAEQIRSRFDGNTEQYLKTLHDQKFTQEQFQEKIAARLKQTEQLYRATAQAADPSDEDLKTYYDLIRDQLTPLICGKPGTSSWLPCTRMKPRSNRRRKRCWRDCKMGKPSPGSPGNSVKTSVPRPQAGNLAGSAPSARGKPWAWIWQTFPTTSRCFLKAGGDGTL